MQAVSRLQAKPMGTMASLLKQLGTSSERKSPPWQSLVGRNPRYPRLQGLPNINGHLVLGIDGYQVTRVLRDE